MIVIESDALIQTFYHRYKFNVRLRERKGRERGEWERRWKGLNINLYKTIYTRPIFSHCLFSLSLLYTSWVFFRVPCLCCVVQFRKRGQNASSAYLLRRTCVSLDKKSTGVTGIKWTYQRLRLLCATVHWVQWWRPGLWVWYPK